MPTAPTLSSETSLNRGAVRASVEHAAPAVAPDAESRRVQEMAAKIRKKKEEKGAHAPIAEDMVNSKPPAFTEQRIQLAARNNIIGTELKRDGTISRNTDGSPKMTKAEQQRHDQVVTIGKLANVFKEQGVDGLLANGNVKIDGKDVNPGEFFRSRVEQALRSNPRMEAELSSIGTDPAQLEAALKSIMDHPEVRANVHKLLSEGFGRTLSADAVANAMRDTQQKQREKTQKETAKAKAEEKKNAAAASLNEFNNKKLSTGKTKLEELQELSISVPEKQRTKAQYEEEAARAKEEAANYETLLRKGKLPPDEQKEYREKHAKAIESLSNAKRTLTGLNADLGKYSQLYNEKAGYENAKRQAEEEEDALGGEIFDATNAYHDANADFNKARLEQEAQEIEYVQELTAVFEKAAVGFIVKDIQANEQVANEIKDEEIANTKDYAQKTFKRELRARWGREVTETVGKGFFGIRGTEERTRTEWNGNVDTDKALLIDEVDGGPDAVMREILKASGLGRTQIDHVMKDEAFLADMRPRVITELLDAAVNKNGSKAFTAEEARAIRENNWVSEPLVQRLKTLGKSELANFIEQQTQDNGTVSDDEMKAKFKLSFKELLLLVLGSAVFDSLKGGGGVLSAATTVTP